MRKWGYYIIPHFLILTNINMSLVVELNSYNKKHRLKENILKSGVLRTTRFWYKSARNNRLKDYFKIEKTGALEFANTIDQMFTLLNRHYPDVWDVHIDILDDDKRIVIYSIKIIIKFPQITITNSRNESHEIKDLYVVLPIIINVNDKLIIGRPSGTRGTVSFAEKQSSYAHSHLNSINFLLNQYTTPLFCLGSGPLVDIFNRIEDTGMSMEDFEAILVFLDDFVRWESIEGVPYKYIKDITEYSTKNIIYIHNFNYTRYLTENKISDIISMIRDKTPNLSFNYYKDRIVLSSNKALSDIVKEFIFTQYSHAISNLIVKKENDIYYSYSEDSVEVNNERNSYTVFRGQEYQFTVEDPIDETISIDAYEVNPVYLNLLIDKLNDKIYENAIRKSIIEQQA